jgi:hypothetical protein
LYSIKISKKDKEKTMRKIIAAFVSTAFICTLTCTAMAGGPKPPKSLCLQTVQDGGPVLALGIKKGHKFMGPGVKFQMYTVQGVAVPMSLSGAGYMHLDYFTFHISSSFGDTSYDMAGAWDVANETGTLTVNETTPPGDHVSQDYDLLLLPCDAL